MMRRVLAGLAFLVAVAAPAGAQLPLVLKGKVSDARFSQVKGAFEKNEYKGEDGVVPGGRCAYSVRLKKEG